MIWNDHSPCGPDTELPDTYVIDTYPNSGTAIEGKGLNLSILQKHLQHIWYE